MYSSDGEEKKNIRNFGWDTLGSSHFELKEGDGVMLELNETGCDNVKLTELASHQLSSIKSSASFTSELVSHKRS